MIVVVDGPAAQVRLEQAEDLKGLSVKLRGCTAAEADPLSSFGRLDGEHAWLDIAALRSLSPRQDDPTWSEGFDGTMAYARSKGWADGVHVRAHLA